MRQLKNSRHTLAIISVLGLLIAAPAMSFAQVLPDTPANRAHGVVGCTQTSSGITCPGTSGSGGGSSSSSGSGDSGASEAGRRIGRWLRESIIELFSPSGPTAEEQQQRRQAKELNEQGLVLAEQGDFAGALAKFREVLTFNPSSKVNRANAAGMEAGIAWHSGNLELAVAKAREALSYNDHPTWQKLVADTEHDLTEKRAEERQRREAEDQARLQRQRAEQEEQERKRKEAETAAKIRQSVDSLVASLQSQRSPDFDGRTTPSAAAGGLDFMASTPTVGSRSTAAPSGTLPTQGSVDSSVVDLRDARTLTVDPAKVTGGSTQRTQQQGLQFMTSVQQPVTPEIAEMTRRIKAINVPPPIPQQEASIRLGELAPNDKTTKKVILGLEAGVGILHVAGRIGGRVVPAARLIIAAGSTIIAAENAADVYLVKQEKTYEKALVWLRDNTNRSQFTSIVRAVKENRPLPENASIEMVRTARAILDPKLGNSGMRIAWDAMLSPEAKRAALTRASIELAGEIVGQASGRIAGRIIAARDPAFQEATEFLSRARVALQQTQDPAARRALNEAIQQANEMIAAAYGTARPGAHGMEHIESIFTKHELEEIAEKKN